MPVYGEDHSGGTRPGWTCPVSKQQWWDSNYSKNNTRVKSVQLGLSLCSAWDEFVTKHWILLTKPLFN